MDKPQIHTVLKGSGLFYDFGENRYYEIEALHLPSSPAGKDISIHSQDEYMVDVTEWRAYTDGRIEKFQVESISYW